MTHYCITKPEFDWATETGLYALNAHSGLFENTSAVEGFYIRIFDDGNIVDEEVLDELYKEECEEIEVEYFLYDGQHHLVGYVYSNLED